MARETLGLADLQMHGASDEAALVSRVHASTDQRLPGVAWRSLRARLVKLRADGAVVQSDDGRWQPAAECAPD